LWLLLQAGVAKQQPAKPNQQAGKAGQQQQQEADPGLVRCS
jgi:hypothetical protein